MEFDERTGKPVRKHGKAPTGISQEQYEREREWEDSKNGEGKSGWEKTAEGYKDKQTGEEYGQLERQKKVVPEKREGISAVMKRDGEVNQGLEVEGYTRRERERIAFLAIGYIEHGVLSLLSPIACKVLWEVVARLHKQARAGAVNADGIAHKLRISRSTVYECFREFEWYELIGRKRIGGRRLVSVRRWDTARAKLITKGKASGVNGDFVVSKWPGRKARRKMPVEVRQRLRETGQKGPLQSPHAEDSKVRTVRTAKSAREGQ